MRFDFKMGTIVAPINKDFTRVNYEKIDYCLYHIIDFSNVNKYNVLIEPINKSKFRAYGLDSKAVIISHKKLVPFWVQIGDAFISKITGETVIVDIIEINTKRGNSFEYEFFVSNFDKPFNDSITLQEWELERYYVPTKRY